MATELTLSIDFLLDRKYPKAKNYLISFCHLGLQASSSCQVSTMVNLVSGAVRRVEKNDVIILVGKVGENGCMSVEGREFW